MEKQNAMTVIPLLLHRFLSLHIGGGTYFSCLQRTIRLKKGQVLIHPGTLYHKGVDITSGVRNLLVCFMDGFDPKIQDTSDWSNDLPEWEDRIRTV
jgi:hypothetical protein